MNRVKMWVVILLVFILGTMTGALGMRQYINHKVAGFFKRGGEARVEAFLAKMTRDFDLKDSQQVEIKMILQESHSNIEKIKRETDPRIRSIINDSFKRIREKLNDRQKKIFDDHRERIKKRGERRQPLF